jgi:hypothetical protein
MKDEEKREKYSKYACHELNYFLYRKDPGFFETVVQPYLRNKKDKTFMDHFLLGDDLAGYTTPWAYGRLNVVERVLLGQRIAAEKDRVARQIKESLDLVPPDVERFNHLFRTALGGNALSQNEGASFATTQPTLTGVNGRLGGFRGGEGSAATGVPGSLMQAQEKMEQQTKTVAGMTRNSAVQRRRGEDAGGKAKIIEQAKKLDEATAMKDQLDVIDADMAMAEAPGEMDRKRSELRQYYRKLDKTMEWAENNYYHLPIEVQVAELVKVNPYWRDLAEWKGGAFLS